MKKIIFAVFLALSKSEASMTWFTNSKIDELKIAKFNNLSDKTPAKERIIRDPEYLKWLVISFNQLPEEKYPMMVKMGPNAKFTALTFTASDKTQTTVKIFNQNLQLPGTGFYAGKMPLEAKLIVEEIDLLLTESYPYNKPVPYYKNAEFKFENFRLSYIGQEDRTPKGTTATSIVETFRVVTEQGESKNIEVHSGQLPPRSVPFVINGKNFILHTYNFRGENIMLRNLVIELKTEN